MANFIYTYYLLQLINQTFWQVN